jgi:hypothetical protein
MPTDDQDRHRRYPTSSDSGWSRAEPLPNLTAQPQSRRTELDRIHLIDMKRRQLFDYFCPLGIREIDHLWDDEELS